MKINKLIISILTLFLVLNFWSCKSQVEPEVNPNNPKEEYYTITLNQEYIARTALPDVDLTKYWCVATLQSSTGTLATTSGTNITQITTKTLADSMAIFLAYYKDKATAESSLSNYSFSGTSSDFTKSELENSSFTVNVTVTPVTPSDDTTGKINLKIKIPAQKSYTDYTGTNLDTEQKTEDITIASSTAEIYKYPTLADDPIKTQEITITDQIGTINFNNQEITTGLYLLKLIFTDDQGNTATIIEGVNVWNNLETNTFTNANTEDGAKVINEKYFLSGSTAITLNKYYSKYKGSISYPSIYGYSSNGSIITSNASKPLANINDFTTGEYGAWCYIAFDTTSLSNTYIDYSIFHFTLPKGTIITSAKTSYNKYLSENSTETITNDNPVQTFDYATREYTIKTPSYPGISTITLNIKAQNGNIKTFSFIERHDTSYITNDMTLENALYAFKNAVNQLKFSQYLSIYIDQNSPLDSSIFNLDETYNKYFKLNLIFDNSEHTEYTFTDKLFNNAKFDSVRITKTNTSNALKLNLDNESTLQITGGSTGSAASTGFFCTNSTVEFSGTQNFNLIITTATDLNNINLNQTYNIPVTITSQTHQLTLPEANFTGTFGKDLKSTNVNIPINSSTKISGTLELTDCYAILSTSPDSLKIKMNSANPLTFNSDCTEVDSTLKNQPVYSIIPYSFNEGTQIIDVSTFPENKLGYTSLEEYLKLFQILDADGNILSNYSIDATGKLKKSGLTATATFGGLVDSAIEFSLTQDTVDSTKISITCCTYYTGTPEISYPDKIIVDGYLSTQFADLNIQDKYKYDSGILTIKEQGVHIISVYHEYNGIAYSETFEVIVK